MERCTKPNNNQAAEAVFLHRVGLRHSGGALISTGVPLLFAPMANSKRKHDAASVTANNTSEIPEEILQRKGARTTAAVPQAVRDLLNCGQIESANLCEWLIVRTWACAMIGQRFNLTLTSKLTLLRPLAADPNMGVRKIAAGLVRVQNPIRILTNPGT